VNCFLNEKQSQSAEFSPMGHRRSEFDVTNSVNTTEPQAVAAEVCRIYRDLYQRDSVENLPAIFDDIGKLYAGEHPAYNACDTDYHDIQHVLDVTLAMARLLDGCVRATNADMVDERLFRVGVITALYHDCGYIRHRKDTKHENGAEYTATHVSRGARFIEDYLPTIGMADIAQNAARTVHFTGYEVQVDKIRVPPPYRLIGNLLGSADILAQMADRCYLEKCYDRLYPEFLRGGIARKRGADGKDQIIFSSAADLIFKTPRFYAGAIKRLTVDLGSYYNHIETHFGGQNLYFDEVEKNMGHARSVAAENDISLLRRKPPQTIADSKLSPDQPRLI
jgi:hypothetical protein